MGSGAAAPPLIPLSQYSATPVILNEVKDHLPVKRSSVIDSIAKDCPI